MAQPRVVLVTGANRGIGLAICQKLATGYVGPLVLYAASRAGAPITLPPTAASSVKVIPAKITLTDSDSIVALASRVRSEQGGCDVLINNAGIYYYWADITAEQRKETLDVNTRGTIKMCQAFLPIMRHNGRIVSLSSQSGQLKYFAPEIRERFLKPDLTIPGVLDIVDEYQQLGDKGVATEQGWPPMAYFPSKAALNAATRIFARDNPNLVINCCCPGWVDTPLGAQAGTPPKTLEQGAIIPLRLGFEDLGGVSGRYWANPSTADIGPGEVRSW